MNPIAKLFQFRAPVPAPKKEPSYAALFQPQAIDRLVYFLTSFPDPDETLRQAGLQRSALRSLLTDDEVEAALETRRSALLRTPWRLEPGEGAASEFIWAELERYQETLLGGAWAAVPFGLSILEATYEKREGGRIGWAELEERPFEWFGLDTDRRLRYYPRELGGHAADGVLVDTTFKFFLTRRRPTYRQPYGEALLSRLYWPWFFRTQGWQFWARFLERFGAPLLLGKTEGDVNKMVTALAAAVQSAVAAVGPGDDVQAISPGNAGDAFDRFSKAVDRRIQKVVLGQTLTTDVGDSGSYAAARVHDDVRDDRRLGDVRMVSRTGQAAVDALLALNFPGQELRFVMEDSTGLEADRAERDAKLVQAGVLELTEQYLLDRYDFEPGDFQVPNKPEEQPVPPVKEAKASLFRRFGIPGPGRLFAERRPRFTGNQEALEELADQELEAGRQPVDPKLIRAAVFAAKGPEDLAERLGVLMQEQPPEAFGAALERALFVADVLGYCAAEES